MSVMDFIQNNWALVLITAAMCIMIVTTVHLSRKMAVKMILIVLLIFVLSVITYIENALAAGEYFSIWRSVLTAAKYFIPGLLLALVIFTFLDVRTPLLFVPSAICGTLCFLSVLNSWIFYIRTDNNTFGRGPIWFLPFLVDGLYLIILTYLLIKKSGFRFNDFLPVIFLLLTVIATIILPFIWLESFERWFCVTIAIDVFVYYVYLIQQLTKLDALTGLMNRHCWYSDISRSGDDVTAIISLDMNGLKKLNDTEGHDAGDRGISTLAYCFRSSAHFKHRVYRIGGDEFVILCMNDSRENVDKLIERIRTAVAKTPYSCSIGVCYREKGMSLTDMELIADERMYEEKRAQNAIRE